ncbi:VOC family protein [Natronosalvus halobius]|uniref:VOC family protein n=1 Tax=Natronosalvus halobius TaxID=2953746 RepID=UPI00209F5022|nr:VOC family protein [Natronosalvus halobius]USZ71861.1 VOC family protein [Natronosalvus halobius]
MTDHLPGSTRIGRTALTVANLEKSIEFYRDVVGLVVRAKSEAAATLGTETEPLLELRRDADAQPRNRNQAGLFHNAFEVTSRAALGATLERIRDRWTLNGASDHYVSEALYLDDPEGNGVEIYCDRPQSAWPRRDDGTVRIGTIPLDLEAVAAESDRAATVPDGTTVGHVHLETTSLEAAREFYVETLGFQVQTEIHGALFVSAGGYHHHLGVNAWAGRSQPRPADGRGLAWVELLVPSTTALETIRDRLDVTGVSVTERESGFETTDPDGVTVRIRIA